MIDDEFKDSLREKFLKLLETERGAQAKLAKSIGKPNSYFSAVKRGNPVNALHLRAVGLVYGPAMVNNLLGIVYEPESAAVNNNNLIEIEHIGLIKQFHDKAMGKRINEKLIELQGISEPMLQKVESFIESAIFIARSESGGTSVSSNQFGRSEGKLKNGTEE